MNYRHAYHAGNFADVLKHALLCWTIRYLQQKEAPAAFIDTHAGRGIYDLTGPEAAKTGEAKDGILKLLTRTGAPGVFKPYLDEVRSLAISPPSASPLEGEAGARGTRATDEGSLYPGSAVLMLALARPTDRVVAIELHPGEAEVLKRTLLLPGTAASFAQATAAESVQARPPKPWRRRGFQPALQTPKQHTRSRGVAEEERANSASSAPLRANPNLTILTGDGYTTLLKQIPPREKRGLVLIDPPFETDDEFERLAKTFIAAHRKWPTGVYVLWFPIKQETEVTRFASELTNAAIPKLTLVTLDVARAEGLSRTGLLLCNAPFTLEAEWRQPLAWLAETLAQGPHYAAAVQPLTP